MVFLIPLAIVAVSAAGGLTWAVVNDTAEGKTVSELKDKYKSAYPNWPQNLGFNEVDAAKIFGKFRYGVRAKYWGPRDYTAAAKAISKDLKIADYRKAHNLLIFLSDITDNDLKRYYAGEDVGSEKVAAGAKRIGANVSQVTKELDASLPWYMRPKTLAIAAGVGLVVVVLIQTGAARRAAGAIISARKSPEGGDYKKNPVALDPAFEVDALYNQFHQAPPSEHFKINSPDVSHLAQLGDVLEIGYKSDKWNQEPTDYLHEFETPPQLFATRDGRSLVITGGNLRIKSSGING